MPSITEIKNAAKEFQTSPFVAFVMLRDKLHYAPALKKCQEMLSTVHKVPDFGEPLSRERTIHDGMVATGLSRPEVEILLRCDINFYFPSNQELLAQRTGPWARAMVMYGFDGQFAEEKYKERYFECLTKADPRNLPVFPHTANGQILDLMRKYDTCALVAYYMFDSGDQDYPKALRYRQQHSRPLSDYELETLQYKQDGEIQRGVRETGLSEAVVSRLVSLAAPEKFDEPTVGEQLRLHVGPWAVGMLKYGWDQQAARQVYIDSYIRKLTNPLNKEFYGF